jgi:uncharacterized membrane protein YozB (DUF420 family)
MNAFTFSLIVSAIITVVLFVTKHNDNKEPNNIYGIKIFVMSFLVVFVCHSYLIGVNSTVMQDIDIGEPPF